MKGIKKNATDQYDASYVETLVVYDTISGTICHHNLNVTASDLDDSVEKPTIKETTNMSPLNN